MTLIGGLVFNTLRWAIAYLIEVIKGDPELNALVRKNKWIALLSMLVMGLFCATAYQYINFIKTDETLKRLAITHQSMAVEYQALTKQYNVKVVDHQFTQSRVTRLEQLIDARTATMNQALDEARSLRLALEQRDHIITELTEVKDTVLKERLLARLSHLKKEYESP